MSDASNTRTAFVVCLHNEGYEASLQLHKIYRVLPDPKAGKEGHLRIIDESGEDYLFPQAWFVAIDVPEAVQASLLR